MAGKPSKAAYWNPILESDRIKTALSFVMKKKGWSLRKLSIESGITYSRLSRYFGNKKGGITTLQLYHLVDMLGFEIKIQIKKKDEFSE
jgi:transcriptional regulator with XRE-family HTH domain